MRQKMKSIQEIRAEFQNAAETELDALCRVYLEDERKGVRALIEKVEKRRKGWRRSGHV